ncbi:MAG: phage/plasmid primase, P4 family [Nitrospirales bacterium]
MATRQGTRCPGGLLRAGDGTQGARCGAVVSFVELPDGSPKRGLDDFFAQIPAFKVQTFAGCQRYALDAPRFKSLAAWHQKWEKRQHDGGDQGLTKILADEILRTDNFAKDAGGRLYAYMGGVYRPGGGHVVAARVKRLLDLNHDSRRWSTHRAAEVTAYLAVDAPILWERPPLDILNTRNGLLDLYTGTLSPHSPDHRSSIQLPLTYDPAARSQEWDEFIRDVFPEDCDTLAYEMIAWLLCPDTSIQRAFLLRGDGENGKSTFLSAVTAALGTDNVAGLSLHKLETDRFAVARLVGRLANICPDLPSNDLSSTSVFKALVGGDRLLGEYKYGESFEFLPFARLLFSANHFPQSKDSSYAFFRRWEVIPFDRTITLEQRRAKPDMLARLTKQEELSGVLNRCLAVLPALRTRGGFLQTKSTAAARVEFQECTDPLGVWLDHHTVLDPTGVVTKQDLFVKYSAESAEAGRPITPARTLYAAIRRLRPTLHESQRRVNGNRRDVFAGLSFRKVVGGVRGVSSPSLPSELLGKEKEEEEIRRGVGETADTPDAHDGPAAVNDPETVGVDTVIDAGPR